LKPCEGGTNAKVNFLHKVSYLSKLENNNEEKSAHPFDKNNMAEKIY
jgi:hypothetical protein